ncbi:hypothetical protein GGR57DRAFT_208500 [Xylariaceae sp. FL1272]|nr:hypothetical protein GGR57DRAFT_208500 [Xylariaceae sp. FL1272]
MASSSIPSPNPQQVIGPLIPSLPAAAVSLRPSDSVLPLLTPILQQRVNILSFNSSNDPWIRLLCYEPSKVPKLAEIAQSERLEPHPVSGEVEIDWDYDTEVRYRRVDEETLQALVVLNELELVFRLLYCISDSEQKNGWKVAEVSVTEKPSSFSSFGGVSTIAEADRQFSESKNKVATKPYTSTYQSAYLNPAPVDEDDDDDDDDYWARYDATPGNKTPATKRSPAPQVMPRINNNVSASAEDEYFAQYDSVQPAMDNHDPDEAVDISPPLGLAHAVHNAASYGGPVGEEEDNGIQGSWTLAEPPRSSSAHSRSGDDPALVHPHPRPASSADSHSSVEKLEAAAARQEQNDFGVKQHVSRSIKSLFMLSRASGIDREEFECMVRTELDMLNLMED